MAEDNRGAGAAANATGAVYMFGLGGQANWLSHGLGSFYVLVTVLGISGEDITTSFRTTALTYANQSNGVHVNAKYGVTKLAASNVDALFGGVGGGSTNGCYTAGSSNVFTTNVRV